MLELADRLAASDPALAELYAAQSGPGPASSTTELDGS
jgi:hypothetical protein